jgi:hypothetical protein
MPGVANAIVPIILSAGTVGTIAQIAITIGLNLAINALTGKKKQRGIGPQAREVTVRGTVQPRQLIYGQLRTAGFIAYFGTGGEDNRYLYYVIVCASHQVEELGDVWLDAQRVNSTQFDGSTGAVLSGAFLNGSTPRLHRFVHLGTSNQAVDADLTSKLPAIWTSNHKGSGVAYVVFRLDRDEKIYPGGAPQNFYVHVKGRRLYDPRKDSTRAGGSGSHRVTDATTWEYSNNPALIALDYIFGGSLYYNVSTPVNKLTLGEDPARIDYAYFMAAANVCDEEVLIPPASPTTEQRRFACDIQLSCDDTHKENMESILSSCVGHLSYVNGKYRLFVGTYDLPQISLGEDDILGPVKLATHPPGDENYNQVIGTFFDESRSFQPVPFPARRNSGYVTQDNGERPRSIELPGTRNSYSAQRIAEIILRQSRNKLYVSFEALSPKAMNIAEWETFTVSIGEYGWVDKVFRCVRWSFLPSGFISIEARVETSAAYADLLVSEYAGIGAAVSPDPEIEIPSPVTNFTAAGARDGIQFSWNLPSSGLFGGVVALYEHTSATPFSSATEIWRGVATGKFISKTDTTQRFYWTRVLAGSRSSTTAPATSGLPASASSADTALSAFASPTSVSASDDDQNGSATTNSTTVTPSGGTGGYSYAWTFASGGSGISITSSTSASTTFSATSLTSGESRSGVARCTVTDGASATFTVDVSVSITRPTPTLSASVAPLALVNERFGIGFIQTTEDAVCTGTPSGGTFQWLLFDGVGGISITSPTAAATRFSATFSGSTTVKQNRFFCRYTKDGVSVDSNLIVVQFNRND